MIFPPKDASPAQVADQFVQRTIIGMMLLSISYGGKAAMSIVPTGVVKVIAPVSVLLSVAIVLVVAPGFIRYFALRKAGGGNCPEADSYITQMYREAAVWAFSFTFILLMALGFGTELGLHTWPTAFVLNGTIALSLAALAFSFYRLTRDTDEEDDDFDQEQGA
ncbi:MAG: hypothetical protein HWE25_06655 [Alphaproteobacteria bacterium]|nr:hypothetical protein [Alphaproteobacteria bacterium]